ncbi:hypothetical protein [Solicola sp. PLA-1-18]|uniref:hypothetical protein n=1 Tax=Solicola sp. PLA-1-18 TaxID=3380532 RepID=UPI003B7F353C
MTDTNQTSSTRSTTMNLMHEELARAQSLERLERAHHERRSVELLRAKRLTRRAERAAMQARLHLARMI